MAMIIVLRITVRDAAGVVLEDHVARTVRGLLGWRAAARAVWGAAARIRTEVAYLGVRS